MNQPQRCQPLHLTLLWCCIIPKRCSFKCSFAVWATAGGVKTNNPFPFHWIVQLRGIASEAAARLVELHHQNEDLEDKKEELEVHTTLGCFK